MNIVIYVYNGFIVLDVIGLYEVLSWLFKVNIKFVGEEKGVIVLDIYFLKIFVEYDIIEVSIVDILVVFGFIVGFF